MRETLTQILLFIGVILLGWLILSRYTPAGAQTVATDDKDIIIEELLETKTMLEAEVIKVRDIKAKEVVDLRNNRIKLADFIDPVTAQYEINGKLYQLVLIK